MSKISISIDKINIADLSCIYNIQIRAFKDDAKESPEFSPGNEEFNEFTKKLNKFDCYKIVKDNEVIGGIFIRHYKEKIWKLSRLFIDPKYQSCGIGSIVLSKLNQLENDVDKWILETAKNNIRSQKFYEKNDFKKVSYENAGENLVTVLYSRKVYE